MLLISVGYAEEKSMWTKFVEFFTPTSEVEGDGPLYDAFFAFYEAVRRMLPKNKIGAQMLTKLRVYKGSEHKHAAQKPEQLDL